MPVGVKLDKSRNQLGVKRDASILQIGAKSFGAEGRFAPTANPAIPRVDNSNQLMNEASSDMQRGREVMGLNVRSKGEKRKLMPLEKPRKRDNYGYSKSYV